MTIRVTRPEDLLATVPYQLGFHPEASVVVLITRAGIVRFVARFDVPREPSRADAEVAAQCDRLGWQIAQADGDGAVLALYDDSPLGWGTLLAVGDQVALWGLQILLSAVVAAGHWRELGGRDPDGWGAWHRLPDPGGSPGVAEFVGMGRVAAPDRDSALARVRPDHAALAAAPALSRRQRLVPVRAVSEWREFFRIGEPDRPDGWMPSPDGAVRMARSLLDRGFRDALIAVLVPGVLDAAHVEPRAWGRAADLAQDVLVPPDGSPAEPAWDPESWVHQRTAGLLERFLRLARSCPRPLSAGPYAVAAVLAGRLGEGCICTAAIEEAVAADPDHVLARILAEVVDAGLLPGHLVGGGRSGGRGAA